MTKASHPCWLSPPDIGRLLRIKPDRVITPIRAGKLPAIDVRSSGSRRPRFRLKLKDVEQALTVRVEPNGRAKKRKRQGVVEFF